MRLQILGSNSAGNCYTLSNEKEVLIIECGVGINEIKKAIGFNSSKVAGCLISHDHQDHSKSANKLISAGISIYASAGTLESLRIVTHHRTKILHSGQQEKIGSFRILPFDVDHDAKEPMGFLIHHPESGNLLFLTDTYYVPFTFPNLNNIMIEANYSQDILDRNVASGASVIVRNRVLESHLSLDTCKDFLRANDLSKVNNIVLLHLSNGNSDAELFKKEIIELTGKSVHIAEAGMIIDNFNISPF